jgi:hypothetical protein
MNKELKEVKIPEILIYKGIEFDEFTRDEYGLWGEICQHCLDKNPQLKEDIDDGMTAMGCCSVRGCKNTGEDQEENHYYIDFKKEEVTFKEITLDQIRAELHHRDNPDADQRYDDMLYYYSSEELNLFEEILTMKEMRHAG